MPVRASGQPKKKQCVLGSEWDQDSVKLGQWCSTEGSALLQKFLTSEWVLLRATLFICAEAVWLSWQLFIDAFCLSAFVFYLIDLFSVPNRWCIPKILFSNVLLPGSGMFSVKPWFFLRCWSLQGSHELWPLQLTFWTAFQKMWFSTLSGFSSSSDSRLLMLRPKTLFPLLSHFHIPEWWQVKRCFGSV